MTSPISSVGLATALLQRLDGLTFPAACKRTSSGACHSVGRILAEAKNFLPIGDRAGGGTACSRLKTEEEAKASENPAHKEPGGIRRHYNARAASSLPWDRTITSLGDGHND